MKRSTVLMLFLLCFSFLATAQTQTTTQRERDRHDNLGDQLGNTIEDFIKEITREFSEFNDTPSDVDTIPSGTKTPDDDQWKKPGASITYDGDKIVEEDETIKANVVVKAGDLTVFGSIEGDVLVVGGTLYVKNGGSISGNARVINGDIVKEEDGFVGGYMDKTGASTAGYRLDRRRFTRSGYRLDASWVNELTNLDNFIYRYNRVEGHFFGLGSEKKYYWDGAKRYTAYGSVGWGAKSHRWRYNLGVSRQFVLPYSEESGGEILEIGVEGHSITGTKDDWIISMNENTAAALLIHEDYRDYFGREGVGIHAGYYTQQDYIAAQFEVTYLLDTYASLDARTEWSIFGGNKVFRPNPSIDDGKMRSIVVTPGFSTVTKTSRGNEGWSIYGTAEFAKKSYGSDFNFSQIIADVRRYQPLTHYDNLNIRLRVGSSGGTVPVQKIFEFGGLSTLHARSYKSEIGNRMILLNSEYIVNGDFLHDLDFWPSWVFRHINFIVLSDAGLMRMAAPEAGWTDGFENIRLSEFRHDFGVGVANRSGSFRAGFVWRTDVKAPARFFFRFTRPF